jgi:hypothetical protein
MPRDYLTCVLEMAENMEGWGGALGWWLLRSRLSLLHHVSWYALLRLVIAAFRLLRPAVARLDRIQQELEETGSTG